MALALGVSGLPQWERKTLTEEEEASPEADDAFIVAKADIARGRRSMTASSTAHDR